MKAVRNSVDPELERKMQQFKMFDLPFTIDSANLKPSQTFKISDEIIYQAKLSLVQGFTSKRRLFDIASQVTEKLEETEGGYWLCNIRPIDIENGLIKSEYRGFTLSFSRDAIDYEI